MFFGGFPFEGMPGGGMPHHRSKEVSYKVTQTFNNFQPVDTEKLYKLLDLPKDCSDSEIKKAYRKLAIKHHPDKGGDPEKFKEISKAYEILSDPDKRRIYDEHGEEGLDGSYTATDASDIFDLFFGGGRKPKGKKRGDDIVTHLKVTLEHIYNGTMKKLSITKDVICNECEGYGGPKDAFITCSSCGGQGIRVQIRQMGSMIQQTQSTCSACNGQGQSLPDSKRCKTCSGRGVNQTKKILEVFIEKGVPDQHKITFHGEADERPNEIPGSVIFIINQNPHDTFKRSGNDLFMTKSIPLYEALTGSTFYITHLDDRILKINTPPGEVVKPGCCKVITGEGMPVYKSPFAKGNLYVTFEVVFPVGRMFTQAEKSKLLELFPYTPETAGRPDSHIEEYTAQHFDLEDYRPAEGHRHYDEDDEEVGPNRVQCRQQ